MKRLLSLGLVVLPALSLLAVTAVIAMLFSLNADVAELARRLHREEHAATDMHGQIATLREELTALQVAPSSAAPAKPVQPAPPPEEPHAEQTAVARPIKVTASGTPECVFKAGDPFGLATCIKREQSRIAEARMPARFR